MRTEEEVRKEMERCKIEMDKSYQLAMAEQDVIKSAEHYRKANENAIRYWALRWILKEG